MDRKTAEHVFNYRDTDFPVSAKGYHKIEEQNHCNVNVFGYENKQFFSNQCKQGAGRR